MPDSAATNCYYFPRISAPNDLPQTLEQSQLSRLPFQFKIHVFSGVACNTGLNVPSRPQPSRAPGSNPTILLRACAVRENRLREQARAPSPGFLRGVSMLSVTKQEAQEAPMNVLYAVSARGNPLYRGKFGLHGRYQTYGQHSFIYDLIAAASRRGVHVTLLVEGLSAFALAEPLKEYSRVFEMDERAEVGPVDLILLDEPTDKLVASLPAGSTIICIIHRKTSAYSQEIQDRCDQFLCMTEAALEYQSTRIPVGKLRMVHHGVDLERFKLSNEPRGRTM